MISPEFSFVQFYRPDQLPPQNSALPVAALSDLSFFVNVSKPFVIQAYCPETGNSQNSSYVFDGFGNWIDPSQYLAQFTLGVITKGSRCTQPVFHLAIVQNGERVYLSNALRYVKSAAELKYTALIDYSLDEGGLGWTCPTDTNRVRLPIHVANPQFMQEEHVYRTLNGVQKLLFAQIGRQWELTTDAMTGDEHGKLLMALSHDHVTIDGLPLTLKDNYEIDWENSRTDGDVPRAAATCLLTEHTAQYNSNCTDCSSKTTATIEWIAPQVCKVQGQQLNPVNAEFVVVDNGNLILNLNFEKPLKSDLIIDFFNTVSEKTSGSIIPGRPPAGGVATGKTKLFKGRSSTTVSLPIRWFTPNSSAAGAQFNVVIKMSFDPDQDEYYVYYINPQNLMNLGKPRFEPILEGYGLKYQFIYRTYWDGRLITESQHSMLDGFTSNGEYFDPITESDFGGMTSRQIHARAQALINSVSPWEQKPQVLNQFYAKDCTGGRFLGQGTKAFGFNNSVLFIPKLS